MLNDARDRTRELRDKLTAEIAELRQRAVSGAGAEAWRAREVRLREDLRARIDKVELELRSAGIWKVLRRVQLSAGEQLRFLRNWFGDPLKTGAVAPSGPELCRLMARHAELDRPGFVVELGPGTGAVTQALVERGVDQSRLVLIEYSPDFCALLRERFPSATVVEGNAYALADVMERLGNPPIASVVSGLPLFTRPLPERQALMSEAMRLMPSGAPFIQFSYALVPAVKGLVGVTWSTSRWVMGNLPPARVWLYRQVAG